MLFRSSTQAWSDIPTCKEAGVDTEYQMLRGIFMGPGATPAQVAFYVDMFKKVQATDDWKKFMEDGAFNQTFLAGEEFGKWLATAEKVHYDLMKEAGFLAQDALISMNRDHLLADAKARVIGMAEAGWRPPRATTFLLPGRSGAARAGGSTQGLIDPNEWPGG